MIVSNGRIIQSGSVIRAFKLQPIAKNYIFIFATESVAGGLAPNAPATELELSETPNVQIWDNAGMQDFQNLKCSLPNANNLIGHDGHESENGITHGWELELANQVRAGFFDKDVVYLVKCGQGSSRITQFQTNSAYWLTMKERVLGAINKLLVMNGYENHIYVFLSTGQNDAINEDINADQWEGYMNIFLDNLYALIPTAKIVEHINPTHTQLFIDINNKILKIATERDYFSTKSIDGVSMLDNYHFDYTGNKQICQRFLEIVI